MAFNPEITPFLVPFTLDPSYGMPASVKLTADPDYFNLVYTLGTFNLEPVGNLLQLGSINTRGLVYISSPGATAGTLLFEGGNGILLSDQGIHGTDINISVVPDTTVQQSILHVDGSLVGVSATTDFIPGPGINLTGFNNGFENQVIIGVADPVSSNDHFVITQAGVDLPNATDLGLLGTGILFQTSVTNRATLRIATPGVDFQGPSPYLDQIAAQTPANGALMYFQGGEWINFSPSVTPGQVLSSASSTTLEWIDVPGSSAAPNDAFYLVGHSNVDLTNEINLGALSTGLVLSTVSGGSATISTLNPATFVQETGNYTLAGNLDFNGTTTFDGPIQILTDPVNGYVLTSDGSGNATWQVGSGTNLLPLNNTWSGINTYNGNVVIDSGLQITTSPINGYVLTSDASGHATWQVGSGTNLIPLNNDWTGINTFENDVILNDGLKIVEGAVDGYVLTSDASGNATWEFNAATDLLPLDNTWTGTNTFDDDVFIDSGLQITTGASDGYVLTSDGAGNATWQFNDAANLLPLDNTWTGENTFNIAPIMSGANISTGSIPANSVSGIAATLTGGNIYTNTNTFTGSTEMTGTVKFSLGAVNNYIWTSDGAGNGSWQPNAESDILNTNNTWTGTNTFNNTLIAQTTTFNAQNITSTLVASGFTGSSLQTQQNALQTVDATPQTIIFIPLAVNQSVTITGFIVGAKSDQSDGCGGTFTATVRSGMSGAALVGSPIVMTNRDTTATFDVGVSLNNLVVNVTGLAATAYNWVASYQFCYLNTNA